MTRLRVKYWARYLTLVALAVLLALATGNGWAWGLTAFVLVLPPLSFCGNFLVRTQLGASLSLPTTSPKSSACMATLTLTNKSWLPAARVLCRVRMVNDLTGEERFLWLEASLPPRCGFQREFLLESSHCGRIYVEVEKALLLDCFGLLSMALSLKAGARMTVLPDLFSCQVTLSPTPALAEDSSVSCRGDDPTEVFQLREYQPGDDVRRIHWKLSSKLDGLILRESSQTEDRSLLVYWDKRLPCTPAQMDALAEITASVCQGLCDSGISFDLGWTEGEEQELRTISGEDQLLQTIPALVTQAGKEICPELAPHHYGQVLYISSQPHQIAEKASVHCLICTDQPLAEGNAVTCTPESYRETLERLAI